MIKAKTILIMTEEMVTEIKKSNINIMIYYFKTHSMLTIVYRWFHLKGKNESCDSTILDKRIIDLQALISEYSVLLFYFFLGKHF